MSADLVIESYEGNLIPFQPDDAFVNATEMCKAFGKRPVDFLRLPSTQAFQSALAEEFGSLCENLTVTVNGGTNPGTWLHPDLALECARWLSPKFGIWCNRVIRRILSGELDVKPAIQAPRFNPVRDFLLIGREMGKMKGVDQGLVMACTLDAIEVATGMPATIMRKALPSVAPEDTAALNATQVGDSLGLTARKANTLLEQAGLQQRDENKAWKLTDLGTKHGEMKPFHRNGHSGYEIRWKSSVVEFLREKELLSC